MTLKESFVELAVRIQKDLEGLSWNRAVIKILRLEGSVRFEGEYFDDGENTVENIDVCFGYMEARVVQNIYKITTTEPPYSDNWNRAIFTLYSNNKFEMKYSWDQEYQNRVDGFNNENSRRQYYEFVLSFFSKSYRSYFMYG